MYISKDNYNSLCGFKGGGFDDSPGVSLVLLSRDIYPLFLCQSRDQFKKITWFVVGMIR